MEKNQETASKSIKAWPEAERPRERLLEKGPEVLSQAELLAVLLRNGARGCDAVSLGRELLAHFGGLRGIFKANKKDLERFKGLGPAKISILCAAGEIARRQLEEILPGKEAVRDPESVVQYLKISLRDQPVEVFTVIYLDKGNRILGSENLFRGTLDEAAVYPREIVRSALERHASAVILAHNHPSGRVEPSAEDIRITKKITEACMVLSIKVLDHLIIGDSAYLSFNERGLL